MTFSMRVLVTGANGFVGRVLCTALTQHGYVVRGAVRSSAASTQASCVAVGEITEQTDWSVALTDVDVVIHLAARAHVMRDTAVDPLAEFRRVNTAGTEHLARCAAASGVKRLVYVSSIKVNGEETHGGKKFSEADTPAPQDAYDVSKWEAEKALHRVAHEAGLGVVIVRPPLVYGPGVKANFYSLMRLVNKALPMPLASISNRRSMIYVGNLVDALIVCATNPAAVGQTYLVSDADDVSTPELVRRVAVAMKRPCRIFSFPICVIRLAAKLLGRSAAVDRLTQSLVVDSAKIRNELGWQPPFNMSQGLAITADWFFQSNKTEKPSR